MTATVASYTPTNAQPQAFPVQTTATRLVVNNQTASKLQILIGMASLVDVAPNSQILVSGLVSQSSLVVAPDGLVQTPAMRSLTGQVTITSYDAGDPLPPSSLLEAKTITQHSGMTHFGIERLRAGVPINVRDYGAQGDGVYDDRPAMQAVLDVARVRGGGRKWLPAGTYAVYNAIANGELSTISAALQAGSGTTIAGDGPALTTLKIAGGWAKNPQMGTVVATREFWVSTTGANGNAGTKAAPFRDLSFAVTQCTVAGGGYIIHTAPGVYSDGIINTYAGSTAAGVQGNPNIILSDVPWRAQINSTDSGPTGRAVYLKQGWWIVGFEITNGNLAQSGAVALDGSYSACLCCWIHDFSRGIGAAQGGSGVFVSSTAYQSPGIVIAFNYIYRVGPNGSTQGHGIYANGNGTIVARNLIVFCDGDGIECFHTPANLVIVNNTVYSCGAGAADGGILVGSGDAGWTVSGFYVANNVLVSNTGYGIREFVSGGGIMGANTYTNNLMFNNTVAAFLALGGNVNANPVLSDPLFINQQTDGSGDFRLRGTSPAIDAGTDSGMPAAPWGAVDLLGYSVPVGTHRDIGAYEWLGWGPPGMSLMSNYNPSTGNKDIAVLDLTIDGGATNATGEGAGLAFCRVQRLQLRNVTLKNCVGSRDLGVNDAPALLIDYCSDVDLAGINVVSDDGGPQGSGIILRNCVNVDLRGVRVMNLAYGNGIYLENCQGVRLSNVGVGLCGGAGVALRNCTDVTIDEADIGLLAPNVAVYPYTANQALGNTGHGFSALNSTFKLKGVRSQRNGGSGFWIDGACTADIVSLHTKNNTVDGLTVGGALSSGSIRISGLRSQANTVHGVNCVLAAHATMTRITDHVSSGNGGAQLRIAGVSYGVTGSVSAPAVPATTVALTNPFPFDMTVFITGGTMSLVSLDGSGIGVATSPIYLRVRAGGTVTITYTVAPSWSWYVEN